MTHVRRRIVSLIAVGMIIATGIILAGRGARRRAESMCAGRLFPMNYLALTWAEDAGTNRLPANITYLTNGLAARWMVCPSDRSRRSSRDWLSFTMENTSYEIVSPGSAVNDTNSVFLRCRIHGHTSYADMTVFDGVRRKRKFD